MIGGSFPSNTTYKILQLRLPVYLTLSQGSQTRVPNEAHVGVLCGLRSCSLF